MSKSVIWSSAVFTMFVGSAAYVGVSTAMTPAQPEASYAEAAVVAPVKIVKAKAAVRPVHATIKPTTLKERGA